MGFVEAIFVSPAQALPMVRRARVRARPGVGLDGDRYATGAGYWRDNTVSRDLTLIEAEVIEAVSMVIGVTLPPGAFRRNVVTRGICLNDLVGARFRLGHVVVEGTSLCEPCDYLARLVGQPILQPLVHRGGLRAMLVTGGELVEGDLIETNRPLISPR